MAGSKRKKGGAKAAGASVDAPTKGPEADGAEHADGAGRTASRVAEAAAESAAASARRGGRARRVGRLILIGGGEKRSADGAVLRHVVAAAGGDQARILVCAAASAEPDETLEEYRKVFTELGAKEVLTETLSDRASAESPELVERVDRMTAVFFTGGDQLRLVSTLGGTAFGECVRGRLQGDGLVVAGTSAGAAAMSSVMVTGGEEGGIVRRCDVDLAPGLGYWRDTVVDTHFNERGRVGRLLTIFATNPQVLGIGLDEDTAAHVELGRRMSVVGSGAALVFNGRVTHTNAAEVGADEALAMFDSKIHVLPDGYGFDLERMRPLRPDELV